MLYFLKIIPNILLIISFIKASDNSLPIKPTKLIEFTTDEGTWINIDVSPNGKYIVFDLLGDIYLLTIGKTKALRITDGMAYDTQPQFSPDGNKIVFLSDRSGSENLWLIEIEGEIEKNKMSFKSITNDNDATFSSPTWSNDGQYIVVSRTPRFTWIDVNHNLWIYHIDGGIGKSLLYDEEPIFALGPVFRPKTNELYFSFRHPDDDNAFGHQIDSYNLKTGIRKNITSQVGGAIRPEISSNGEWMVYGSRHDGKTGYRLRNLNNGLERWLTFPVQPDQQENNWMGTSSDHMPGFSFTPDNKFIIAAINGRIHKVSIKNSNRSEIPFEADISLSIKPVIHHNKKVPDGDVQLRQIMYPSLSPDEQNIVFTALNRIYMMNLSTKKIKKLVDMEDHQYYPTWSPDGKKISFITWNDFTGGNVFTVKSSGKSLKKLNKDSYYFKEVAWSPNGDYVAVLFGSWNQSGKNLSIGLLDAEGKKEIKYIKAIKGGGIHFTNDLERIYFNEYGKGLVSININGENLRSELKVYGQRPFLGPGGPQLSNKIILGLNKLTAMVHSDHNIYLVKVPPLGTETPEIFLNDALHASFPIRKINLQGTHYPKWSQNSNIVYWSLGNSIFIWEGDKNKVQSLPTIKIIDINLKFPRYRGNGLIAFKNCTILTMREDLEDNGIIENGVVLIKDNRIIKVNDVDDINIPSNAEIIDANGMYLLPGFIDLHSHMDRDTDIHRGTLWSYLANLAYGVTTTRDPQSMEIDIFTYSDRVATGDMIGPRIFTTGPGIFNDSPINNIEDADHIIEKYADFYHVNTVKQYLAGNRKHRQLLSIAIDKAKLIPTTEGIDMKLMITQVMDGYSLEHVFPHYPLYKDMIQLISESGTYYDPTVIVSTGPRAEYYYWTRTNVHDDEKLKHFFPHEVLDRKTRRVPWYHEDDFYYKEYAKTFKDIVEAGGKIGVGSHGEMQGICYHWEIWNIQSGGMRELDALKCATIIGAEALGFSDDLGSIKVGKLADLVLLKKDPLVDIRNTNSIKYVMKNGLLYDASTLDKIWPEKQALVPQYWHNNTPKTSN
tara:strand:- start:9487 stop:12660 length:3174 start_codon:yes stop_codon:yes gene_type:complete